MWNYSSRLEYNFGEWYVDRGFSKHMTGNKSAFVNIEKDIGSVAFGNNNSAKVLGKGTVKLGSKNSLAVNVLLVDNMKHNLLSSINSSSTKKNEK